MALPTAEQVLDLLRNGTPDQRAAFVTQLPPTDLLDAAAGLVRSTNPAFVVVALGPATLKYCYGLHPEWGAILASALHERAHEISRTIPDHGLQLATLSGLAGGHVKALSLRGRSSEILDVTERYIPMYEEAGDVDNVAAMKVLRIDALVNLKRIDAANAELGDTALLSHRISGMEARRLKGQVDRLRQVVTEIQSEHMAAPVASSAEDMLGMLTAAIDIGLQGEEAARMKKLVAGLDPSNRLDLNNPAHYKQLLDSLNQGDQYLTGGSGALSENTVRGTIRNASAAFVHGTPPPDVIRQSLADLESSLAWAQEHGVSELVNDAHWGIYLCHSRLNQPSEAADALIQLRTSLESLRAGMKDPLKRGGVFGMYPNLFKAMCEKLQKAGRAEDLLVAIESSKGRAIADRLTSASEAVVADQATYSAVARIPQLTRRERFHYVTFFVDDPCVYAAFVSSHGDVHAIEPIPVSSQDLRDAATHVDPRLWQKRSNNLSARLAPLAAWLGRFLDDGTVAKGDHICYSADDDFTNVPLHYLAFRDGILLDWFSVSRVHSAFHLDRVLGRKPERFDSFAGVVVPLRQDLDKSTADTFVANLDAPWQWLHDHGLKGRAARLAEASLERVIAEPLDHRIVHFATHGWFPKDKGNPYHDSFLLLADGRGLPDAKRLREHAGKLTPSLILDSKLNLEDSHISMMACVSGLAREGIAGDTLGLDWAFIQAGASSLLSTHWDIGAASAAWFFQAFYDKWIGAGQSRASAFRETVLEALDGDHSPRALQQWTAFSLTGDFR